MRRNALWHWLTSNKRGLIIGFAFGALIAPLLATLGLVSPAVEVLRPLLIGPMYLVGSVIPNIQIGPDSYTAPLYKWVLTLGFNGAVYAVAGGLFASLLLANSKTR